MSKKPKIKKQVDAAQAEEFVDRIRVTLGGAKIVSAAQDEAAKIDLGNLLLPGTTSAFCKGCLAPIPNAAPGQVFCYSCGIILAGSRFVQTKVRAAPAGWDPVPGAGDPDWTPELGPVPDRPGPEELADRIRTVGLKANSRMDRIERLIVAQAKRIEDLEVQLKRAQSFDPKIHKAVREKMDYASMVSDEEELLEDGYRGWPAIKERKVF